MVKNSSGQVLVFYVASFIVLCLFWFAVVNAGKVLKDRILVQNAADNSALSAAVMRSRALNVLGKLNGVLGLSGFGVHVPGAGFCVGGDSWVWWIEPPRRSPGFHTYHRMARLARSSINKVILLQESIVPTYGGGTTFLVSRNIARRQEINAGGKECGADGFVPMDSLSLNLKRNKGDVLYFKTSELYVPPTPVSPEVWVWPIPYPYERSKNAKRWLEQKRESFHKQRIRVIAYKSRDSVSNRGYPFAGKFFKMDRWVDIKCIAAASSYNNSGYMFPQERDASFMTAFFEYWKSKNPGWKAHLVPVGKWTKH
ncbi:MAG: hypothetical protein KJ967_01585 [Elusimicrobia bacterium]|nr:hypothetical protein [Elusimicrobiota bacterium]